MLLQRTLIVALSVTGLLVACGVPDIQDDMPVTGTSPTDPADSGAYDPAACDGPATLDKMDPKTLPPCCDGTAHCVPTAKIPGIVRKSLAACSGGFCVPDAFLLSGGAQPPACTAFNTQPGSCISKCVPQVADNASLLMQEHGTCAAGELCTPCINPITQMSTGVCEIGKGAPRPPGGCGDSGTGATGTGTGTSGACPHTGAPVVDPSKLPACGDVPGTHCLAANLVPPAMASKLAPCATGLCVPDDFIAAGGNFIPKTCTSLGGIEGRCLHRSLPDVASQADILPASTCGAQELCAPCYHPSTAADTGACHLSCDPGPKQAAPGCPATGPDVFDPTKFTACATGAHCLPDSLLSPAAAADLAVCPSGGRCVPDSFIKTGGRFIPKTCTAIAGAEGRCLSRAIPKIGSQASLTQSSCGSDELCAPCYNPIDGTDTGACRQSCDPGPTKPATLFPQCCGLGGAYRGRCVPSSSVPASEATNLSRDICQNGSDLCAPTENLVPPFNPTACSAPSVVYLLSGGYQGVCLSDCLHFSGLQNLLIKQGTCDNLHQCVPCRDPLGRATGAPGCP